MTGEGSARGQKPMRDDKAQALKNLRTGLILASIAAAVFLGFVLKQYLLSR
ncbi:MAG: hypothetical protein KatS3mg123_1691 [Burkholderiales bacterium]|nr:MAG: hypothetical protein KatS3mg123_1691 [Burkholderiales bacterium]